MHGRRIAILYLRQTRAHSSKLGHTKKKQIHAHTPHSCTNTLRTLLHVTQMHKHTTHTGSHTHHTEFHKHTPCTPYTPTTLPSDPAHTISTQHHANQHAASNFHNCRQHTTHFQLYLSSINGTYASSDCAPLGKAICWNCGRILYGNVGSSRTCLVQPPKDMTKAEATAAAYLQALPYDNGLTFVHINGKWYSYPTCNSPLGHEIA